MSENESYGYQTDHPLLKLFNLRDNLLTFKQIGGETVQEIWLKFQPVLHPCTDHGMSDNVLLECFSRVLGPENRSNVDQLFVGGMLNQSYEVVVELLDGIVEANKETKMKQEWEALLTQLEGLSNRVMELEAQASKKDNYFVL